MAQTLVEKQVLFYGIWRPRHYVDDVFFRYTHTHTHTHTHTPTHTHTHKYIRNRD